MIEIEFRGKPLKGEEKNISVKGGFAYGHLIKDANGTGRWIVGDVMEAGEDYFCPEYWVPVDPKTVGQCTGLRDKNGEKIYAGDIVKMHYFFENANSDTLGVFEGEREVIGVVKIGPCETYTQCIDGDYGWGCYLEEPEEELEKIGNLWDNPELLEVKS